MLTVCHQVGEPIQIRSSVAVSRTVSGVRISPVAPRFCAGNTLSMAVIRVASKSREPFGIPLIRSTDLGLPHLAPELANTSPAASSTARDCPV